MILWYSNTENQRSDFTAFRTFNHSRNAGRGCLPGEVIRLVMIVFFGLILSCFSSVRADPVPTSICDINQYNGVQEGDLVQVEGVCTVETGRFGYSETIISDPQGGPYCCGLVIYDRDQTLIAERGQCVRVCGVVTDYYNVTEIVPDPNYPPEIWDCGWTLPDPEEITDCDADLAPYTSCITKFSCITVTEEPDEYGNQGFSDRTGCFWNILLRKFDPPFAVGDELCAVTGVLDYHFSAFAVRPRDEADIDCRSHAECPYCEGVCDPVVVTATMNFEAPDPITAGNPFIHCVIWKNHCASRNAALFDVLEIENTFWFWPTWTQDIDAVFRTLPDFGSSQEEILHFTWPEDVAAPLHGIFHAAAVNPDTSALISNIASVEFYAD